MSSTSRCAGWSLASLVRCSPYTAQKTKFSKKWLGGCGLLWQAVAGSQHLPAQMTANLCAVHPGRQGSSSRSSTDHLAGCSRPCPVCSVGRATAPHLFGSTSDQSRSTPEPAPTTVTTHTQHCKHRQHVNYNSAQLTPHQAKFETNHGKKHPDQSKTSIKQPIKACRP